jgi:Tetratricopeptide repeat
MLRQPANLDVLFKFATIATQTGDVEGAISALERMLLVNSDLPRVRLELGVLYYRLGSYEVARTYLETALASPALTPEIRSRAEQFMAELQKRQSPSHFAGEVFAGFRYQSNANLGPATSSVRLFGQVANLNQSSIGTADWGFVTSGFLRHTYDLGLQDRAVIETQITAYANRQFQVSAANVSIVDLTSGPRFQVFQGIFEDVTLKPFGTFGYIWVNDTPFYGALGSGLEAGILISDRLRNTSIFVWRRQLHPDTWYVPTNSQFNGAEYTGSTTFQYRLTDIVSIFANGNAQRFITDNTPWQNYQLAGVGGGMQFRFTDPLFKSQLPWSIALSANVQWWSYDAPDATVDPTVTRQQNDTILNVTLFVPFDQRTTLTVSGGRFVRSANLPNYEFINNSALIGVSWRF